MYIMVLEEVPLKGLVNWHDRHTAHVTKKACFVPRPMMFDIKFKSNFPSDF